jgi:hypothetical protein
LKQYASGDEGTGEEVFWFFFSKKNIFPLYLAPAASSG